MRDARNATSPNLKPLLRGTTESDFEFAFEAKRLALGPHIAARWGWDETYQLKLHRQRWSGRPWSIITLDGESIGTLSIKRTEDHVQFGEFYLLPLHQRRGIGTQVLLDIIKYADAEALPIKLEYLKWNPVGSLYKRHGFVVIAENDSHYFLVREPGSF